MLQPYPASVPVKQRHKKRNLFLLIFSVVLLLTSLFLAKTLIPSYSFTGETYYSDGTHLFLAEARPHTLPEETAYNYFLYDVQNDVDKKYSLLPDTEKNRSDKESVMQDKSSFYNKHDELYTNYVVHSISTVDKNKIDQSNHPDYNNNYFNEETSPKYAYYNLNKTVSDLGLKEYEVINVVFTQKYSDKLLALGPQWGEGTLSRNILVGKTDTDNNYKIYEMGLPISVSDFQNDGMDFLTDSFTVAISDNSTTNIKTITDSQQKSSLRMLLSDGKETFENSTNDTPNVLNYMYIKISYEYNNAKISNVYYVYQKDKAYYIEQPYSFIHEITKEVYEQLTDVLTNSRSSSMPSDLSSRSTNTSSHSAVDGYVEEKLQTILSSPKTSSNPQDYINAHKPEYQDLVDQGDDILRDLLSQFDSGMNNDLRGQIMMRICKEILGSRNNVPNSSLSPQDWYNSLNMKQETVLPDYVYKGTNQLEKLVYGTLSLQDSATTNGFDVYAAHIFGSYEEGDKTKVFVAYIGKTYKLYGNTLYEESGGAFPVAITYSKNADGGLSLDKFERARDGNEFVPSIDAFCTLPVSGKEIQYLSNQMTSYYGDYSDIVAIEKQNLIEHLKSQNLAGVSLYTTGGESIPLT